MYYDIDGLCPRGDMEMSSHGFVIMLYRPWKDLVAKSKRTQEDVDRMLDNMGRGWLDACGYDAIMDPDNCGFDKDKSNPPGPDAHPLYEPRSALRVQWGEWGPEHITVPGNACGLDIDHHGLLTHDGKTLCPHNIDNWSQKNLLLIIFTSIATMLATFRDRG